MHRKVVILYRSKNNIDGNLQGGGVVFFQQLDAQGRSEHAPVQ